LSLGDSINNGHWVSRRDFLKESRKRSLVKMLVYRAIITVLLAVISWIFTGNLGQTTIITVVFSILASAIYYLHERMWNNIHWGLNE
jgi:uncharacterized membrane protein